MIGNKLLNDNHLWIVDIGASGGVDSRWKKFTSYCRTVLFEPDPREFENLKLGTDENTIILNTAISDSSGEKDLHLCRRQKNSSVYLPNFDLLKKFADPERFDVLKTVKVNTDTIDNQMRENCIDEIDFIKIDAQGHELPILKGSENILEKVIGLQVEVEFAPIYADQPLLVKSTNF
jgi:FkbM family methyltransferase